MATDTGTLYSASNPKEGDELLLITQPKLRSQLLQARLVNEWSANCIIQRGEQVYLSLRGTPDAAQRRDIAWAVLRLQMGAKLTPQELPDPLRTALLATALGPSPLIVSLLWGAVCGTIGGVMVMALVGLTMTVLNVLQDSYAGIAVTAVAFVLSGKIIGCGIKIYSWHRSSRKTAVSPSKPIRPTPANKPR